MKQLATYWHYLRHLVWLAPVLITAGLVAGLVSGVWNSVPVGLIILGLVVLGLWLTLRLQLAETPSRLWERRSVQTGANALVAVVAMLVILGVVNLLAVRTAVRLDLTENQAFTLAPETQKVVQQLSEPVKVWVFLPEADRRDRTLLETYRRQGDKLDFEFVDPNQKPTLVQQLEVKQPGDVIVQAPDSGRKQFVQSVTTGNPESLLGEGQRLSEEKLTNALIQVTNERPVQVVFVQGHGERSLEPGQVSLSQAIGSLKERGMEITPLVLAENLAIPANTDVVVLAGPQKALFPAEVEALQTYLNNGGNLLLLVDPQTQPGLEPLLAEWGVTLDERVVIDISRQIQQLGPIYALVSQYGNHPITADFGNTLSFYPFARPVDFTPKEAAGIQSTALLFTSDQSWAESDIENPPLQFDEGRDRPGPLLLGAAFSRPVNPPQPSPSPSPAPEASPSPDASPSPEASPAPSPSPDAAAKKEARLVVIGNSSFALDGAFAQGLNGDVLLNSVRWLSQQEQVLSIRAKTTQNRRFTLSGAQGMAIALTALVVLPLVGFGAGVFVWWKRR